MYRKTKIKRFLKDNYQLMPKNYLKTIEVIVYYAIDIFDNNLINITLGGSGGKVEIIDGWSDLDFYIILKTYSYKQVSKFMRVINLNSIHIGTTFYTKKEIENNLIDSKTKIMLYEKNNYNVNPSLYGDEIKKEVLYNEIVYNDFFMFPSFLHICRRNYMEIKNDVFPITKKHIKQLTLLLKCILNINKTFVFGYERIFNEFEKICVKKYKYSMAFSKFNINSILNEPNNLQQFKKEFILYNEFVFDYIEKIHVKDLSVIRTIF